RLLGWPAGTTSVRLARARELLRTRLALRGLALSAAALVVGLTEGTASAVDVSLLAETTAGAALRFAADPTAAGVSTQVSALTEGMVKMMLLQKVKRLAGVFLAVGIACAAAGGLWHAAVTTAPAAAAERPGEPSRGGTGPPAGEAAAAADRPGAAENRNPPPSATADPAQDGPAGPPPRVLATPGGPPLQTRIGLFNMARVFKTAKKFQSVQGELRG